MFFVGSDSPTPSVSSSGTGGECPAGHYCTLGSDLPEACPLGTFNNITRATQLSNCLDCSPGYYCDAAGLEAPVDLCTAGYYCTSRSESSMPSPASAQGGPCPAGSYCPSGATEAMPCLAGTYTLTGVQEACVDCPVGYYCETGADHLTDCPTGTIIHTLYASLITRYPYVAVILSETFTLTFILQTEEATVSF